MKVTTNDTLAGSKEISRLGLGEPVEDEPENMATNDTNGFKITVSPLAIIGRTYSAIGAPFSGIYPGFWSDDCSVVEEKLPKKPITGANGFRAVFTTVVTIGRRDSMIGAFISADAILVIAN